MATTQRKNPYHDVVVSLFIVAIREFLKRVRFLSEQDGELHFPYVRWILTIVFVLAALLFLLGFLLFSRGAVNLESPGNFIIIVTVSGVLFLELALAIPLGLYIGYRINSSVLGPFTRIKRTLKAIGEGDFSQRITLRDDDVLKSIAEAISEMAEELERRFPR